MPDIAFFGFHSGPGGIGRVMTNLINALAAEGVAVDVLISRKDAADASLLAPGVRLIALGEGKRLGSLRPLVRYLNENRPEAVVTNKDWATETVVLSESFARYRPCHVVRVGITVSQVVRSRPPGKRFAKRAALRFFYRRTDGIIGNSQGVVDDVIATTGVPKERTQVIHNPTVTPQIAERAKDAVEHPWLAGDGPPTFLGVGRLTAQKDFATLIRAFSAVRQRRPCRLIILGEGKLRGELEALAAALGVGDDVDLAGFSENPFAMMRAADLFVLSSSREGFPNVLAEAMAVGVPVVATDCPSGPMEILEGGKYGPLVPVGDAEKMANAIETVLDAPPDPTALRARAAEFTASQVVHNYMAALGLTQPGPSRDSGSAIKPLCGSNPHRKAGRLQR